MMGEALVSTTHLITAEELWLMPHADRLELVRGEIRPMAPTGFDHGAIVVTVAAMLSAYVKKHSLGVVVGGEAGFTLARNPDIVARGGCWVCVVFPYSSQWADGEVLGGRRPIWPLKSPRPATHFRKSRIK